jgi:hypothetical protein
LAAWSAKAGANRESDGNDDGDTPVPLVTTSALIDADETAAEAVKPFSLAMEGDVGCGICSIATEV